MMLTAKHVIAAIEGNFLSSIQANAAVLNCYPLLERR